MHCVSLRLFTTIDSLSIGSIRHQSDLLTLGQTVPGERIPEHLLYRICYHPNPFVGNHLALPTHDIRHYCLRRSFSTSGICPFSRMTRLSRRGPWLPEEDTHLIELVRTQGPNNWVRISQQLGHRSPKQCRERYHQNLKPSLNHEPISAHEGELIEQLVTEMGKRWAEIARRLGNRSDNAVKNWWNGSMNRRKRNPSHNQSARQPGSRLYSVSNLKPQRPVYEFPTGMIVPHQLPSPEAQVSTPWPSKALAELHVPMSQRGPQSQTPFPHPYQHDADNTLYQSIANATDHRVPAPQHGSAMSSRLPPLRLPPITISHTDGYDTAIGDKTSISPAISDFSHSFSIRPPPSLVSDAQSTYSISPKTMASPRLSGHSIWIHSERPQSYDYHGIPGQLSLSPLEPGNVTTSFHRKSESSTYLLYPGMNEARNERSCTYGDILPSPNERMRDSRMQLSSLVG